MDKLHNKKKVTVAKAPLNVNKSGERLEASEDMTDKPLVGTRANVSLTQQEAVIKEEFAVDQDAPQSKDTRTNQTRTARVAKPDNSFNERSDVMNEKPTIQ